MVFERPKRLASREDNSESQAGREQASRPRGRGIWRKLGLCAGAVAALLLLLELGWRIARYGGLGPWRLAGTVTADRKEDEYCVYDELLGWRGKPNFDGVHYRDRLPRTRITMNSRGWRDRERPYEKPQGVRRIVVLGDSFAMGLGVEQQEAFPNLLEQEFFKQGVEVINLGMNGYSTDQELLTLMREGVRYQPDLVIVVYFHNDLSDNFYARTIMNNAKPLFEVDEGGTLRLARVPGPKGAGSRTGFLGRLFRGLRNHSAFVRSVWMRIRIARSRGRALTCFEDPGLPNTPIVMGGDLKDPRLKAAIILLKRLLLRIRDTARSHGAQTMVVVVPYEGHVHRQARMPADSDVGMPVSEMILHVFGQRTKVPTLRLLARFVENSRQGQKLFYPGEFHWTPAGHRLAAEEICRFIIKRKLLPAAAGK